MSRPLKILLGDFRHTTLGRHAVMMPLGLGYVAAYVQKALGKDNVQLTMECDADRLIRILEESPPRILALTNYMWNSNLTMRVFRRAKEIDPTVVCVAGGPNVPIPESGLASESEWRRFLEERPEMDFYVVREGERPFANLAMDIHNGLPAEYIQRQGRPGVANLHPDSGALVMGADLPRMKKLDELPSPFLTGLMDQWFTGKYVPFIETVRGCPYQCSYCSQGDSWYNNIYRYSNDRIFAEMTYIVERMKDYPSIPLALADANFGQYEEDISVAAYLRTLMDKYGWPIEIDVSTGKSHYERILAVSEILKNKMEVSVTIQSFNPATTKIISRTNFSVEKYKELHKEIKKRGLPSYVDIIVPLPEETRESYFYGLKVVVEAGVKHIKPFTTMLLKDTRLASRQSRARYEMQTRFRLLPHQFGEYAGEKVFEIEEVCVATNTMTFEDYLDCRGISFMTVMYMDGQFDVLQRLFEELDMSYFDFIVRLWESTAKNETLLSKLYNQFIEATSSELFESEADVLNFYSMPENYTKLLGGYVGYNVFGHSRTKFLVEYSVVSLEMAFDAMLEILPEGTSEILRQGIDAIRKWTVATRDLGPVFGNAGGKMDTVELKLEFDTEAWFNQKGRSQTIEAFQTPVRYRLTRDMDKLRLMFRQARKLYGDDKFHYLPNFIRVHPISNLWRSTEKLSSDEGKSAQEK